MLKKTLFGVTFTEEENGSRFRESVNIQSNISKLSQGPIRTIVSTPSELVGGVCFARSPPQEQRNTTGSKQNPCGCMNGGEEEPATNFMGYSIVCSAVYYGTDNRIHMKKHFWWVDESSSYSSSSKVVFFRRTNIIVSTQSLRIYSSLSDS